MSELDGKPKTFVRNFAERLAEVFREWRLFHLLLISTSNASKPAVPGTTKNNAKPFSGSFEIENKYQFAKHWLHTLYLHLHHTRCRHT